MTRNDEMIEKIDVHYLKRLSELTRQADVRQAWGGDSGRVVVREDHSCGMMGERSLD